MNAFAIPLPAWRETPAAVAHEHGRHAVAGW